MVKLIFSRTAYMPNPGDLSLHGLVRAMGLMVLLLSGFLLCSCAGPETIGPSRISVYSTAYLTQDNQIAYAPQGGTRTGDQKPSNQWTWTGDGVLGSPSIVIDLGAQEAVFFKSGKEVGRAAVSTGREGYGTPTGAFKVIQKNKNHASNLYGDYVDASGDVIKANVGIKTHRRPPGTTFRGAPMPYFMRIHGGVGMHAGHLPGYPASHGCIRLPKAAAKCFFENTPLGTPVTVVH